MSRVIVVAGRRIDPPGGPARFPHWNRDLVCARVADRLRELGATAVVASAACGADLLALQAARALELQLTIVLPFERERFRVSSVVDRPGDFGPIFDRACDSAGQGLHFLNARGEGDAAYAEVNRALLEVAGEVAASLPPPTEIRVLLVWEGARRPGTDLTADLADAARERHLAIDEVSTL